ncbi:3-deoxy-D-manno-octulosonic acid transferase [Tenacibaculum sp. nBUS_03]|uniref:3-deoxy-D-manno-octulosonic acid transferase n=1 Tax=Tenacibaculum sp. nBUS_03 TaxID=3395320 RepID=UPI003EBBD6C9
MNLVYNFSLYFAYFLLKIIALFNKKINLFIEGRKNSFSKLKTISKEDKVIWFHAASLGEFEQGRPIIEKIRKDYPDYKIILTFFSPSGYEIRKDYPLVDIVCYLPFDTRANMQRFIQQIHPKMSIIIKYEFWPNLLDQLKKQNVPTILISGIFRKKQLFFKWYGTFFKNKLQAFDHFFLQNKTSKNLLQSIGFQNITLNGDTRFDRVYTILKQDNTIEAIAKFKNNNYTLVAGSTWPEDEKLLVYYINNFAKKDEKFIIAPHTINPYSIGTLRKQLRKKTILFSESQGVDLEEFQILIIDNIGMLTKIYSYADVAYVGGGLATGLHNILEPATYGVPIVFGGKKYKNFQEAKDLLRQRSVTIVTDKEEICNTFVTIKTDFELRKTMGIGNQNYIKHNLGATEKIFHYLKNIL